MAGKLAFQVLLQFTGPNRRVSYTGIPPGRDTRLKFDAKWINQTCLSNTKGKKQNDYRKNYDTIFSPTRPDTRVNLSILLFNIQTGVYT